jgi:outer membrane protein, heavy metal efflux system
MSFRWAAFVAAVCLWCGPAPAQQPRVLTLESAFDRVLGEHPELARFRHLREGALAAADAERQGPPLRLELELENAPRSDQESAFDSAETTLSLASAFERGGKRAARVAVADAQLDALALAEEQRRADLLAEVARRYLDFVAAHSLADLASHEVRQKEAAVSATAQRVRAGATPDSVRLAAEAALTRAMLHRDRMLSQTRASALRLAILWRSREPDFELGAGDPLAIPETPTLEALRAHIERSPALRQFADQARLREARVQLARSARSFDVDWRVGVRRLEEDGSWAAVAGVSVPLGSAGRAAPGIRSAQAELAALALEREAEELTLEATLVEAHTRLVGARAEVMASRDLLLPKLEQAERASERAFRGGALTYTEWAQVQAEAIDARREQLLAAVEAQRALIEIQRLTGSPFTRTRP